MSAPPTDWRITMTNAATQTATLSDIAKTIAGKFASLQADAFKAEVAATGAVNKVKAGQLALVAELREAGTSETAGKEFAATVAACYNERAVAYNDTKAGKAAPIAETLSDSYVKQLGSYVNGLLACSAEDFAESTKGRASLQNAYKALQDRRRERGDIKAREPKTPTAPTAPTAAAAPKAIVANGVVPDDDAAGTDAKALIERAASLLLQARELLKAQGADKDTLKAFAATIGEVGDLADLL